MYIFGPRSGLTKKSGSLKKDKTKQNLQLLFSGNSYYVTNLAAKGHNDSLIECLFFNQETLTWCERQTRGKQVTITPDYLETKFLEPSLLVYSGNGTLFMRSSNLSKRLTYGHEQNFT